MSFVALILALLIEQVRPLPEGNGLHKAISNWNHWARELIHHGQVRNAWWAWALIVILPSFLVFLIHALLIHILGWFLAMAWTCLVLFACLGFRQFSHHFSTVRNAISAGQYDEAAQALARWKQVDKVSSDPTELNRQLIECATLSSQRHVFGVVFWFSLLAAFGMGPLGAVLYRLTAIAQRDWTVVQDELMPNHGVHSEVAQRAWHVFDWMSARVTALMFAIAGNFEDAMDAWRSQALRQSLNNDEVLICATSGAIGVQLSPQSKVNALSDPASTSSTSPQVHHLRSLVGLVWRTMVVWVVLLGLLTLARLLG